MKAFVYLISTKNTKELVGFLSQNESQAKQKAVNWIESMGSKVQSITLQEETDLSSSPTLVKAILQDCPSGLMCHTPSFDTPIIKTLGILCTNS